MNWNWIEDGQLLLAALGLGSDCLCEMAANVARIFIQQMAAAYQNIHNSGEPGTVFIRWMGSAFIAF